VKEMTNDLTQESNIQIYTILSSFTDLGMKVFHDNNIPDISEEELKTIANYYSIILNHSPNEEGLYGPLPVAYHTEYLVYIYTFNLKDTSVTDPRVVLNDNMVPASILIIFPTYAESFANQVRTKLANGIKVWKSKFKEVKEITKKHINKLNTSIGYTINKEYSLREMTETEKISVVLSKSIELLFNVSNYNDNKMNLLIAGTDDSLGNLTKKVFLNKNSKIIDGYTTDNGTMTFKLGKVSIKVLKIDPHKPNLNKHLSNELNGVMYFGNFSTDEFAEIHSQQLEEIVKNTNQQCLISFAISQTDSPIKIENTRLPEYLAKAKGRTINLFDLANDNMNVGRAILESLDKLVDVIARVKTN
jgi:hypothetical protein